jgi:hypothetical protein
MCIYPTHLLSLATHTPIKTLPTPSDTNFAELNCCICVCFDILSEHGDPLRHPRSYAIEPTFRK